MRAHLGLVATLGLWAALGCSSSSPDALATTGCDPLVPDVCGFPFPSNVWLVDDPKTPTGHHVLFGAQTLPLQHNTLTDPAPWTGSDGCNGTGGRWVAGADGGFLAVGAGVHTLIACSGGADVGGQLAAARRVAVDGPDLVLLDVAGAVAGRFSR